MNELPSLLEAHPEEGEALRVLSVCSGTGGFDLGFHRAGFRTVGLCEFDPWRRRLLARHWGEEVPIWEDLEALADEAEADPEAVRARLGGQPDVLIGGTPCQDLSHAGRRAGLDGSRSGLFWAFCRLRNALGIRWTVWENVAGALTSNGGLDFMAVLGAFVGADVALPGRRAGDGIKHDVPGAGVAAGPWGGCCWRLVNAQHFGVPQRRRRVFVVGRLGGPCEPAVLLDAQGVRRNPAAGAAAGEVAPWAAAARAGGRRRAGADGGGGGGRAAAGGDAADGAAPRAAGGDGGGPGGVGAADGRVGAELGQPVAGPLGGGTPGERGYRADLDSHGAYVADRTNALTVSNAGGRGFDDNAAADGQIVGHVPEVSPCVTKWSNGSGGPSGDECQNLVAPTLARQGVATGQFLGTDGGVVAPTLPASLDRGVGHNKDGQRGRGPDAGDGVADRAGAGDRVPPQREDGQSEGRRAGADADEVGGPGGEHGGELAEADADGVRAAAGMAGRVDGAAAVAGSARDGYGEVDQAPPLTAGGARRGGGNQHEVLVAGTLRAHMPPGGSVGDDANALAVAGAELAGAPEVLDGYNHSVHDVAPTVSQGMTPHHAVHRPGAPGGDLSLLSSEYLERAAMASADPEFVARALEELNRRELAGVAAALCTFPYTTVTDGETWAEAAAARTLAASSAHREDTVVAPTLRGSVGREGGGQKDDAIAWANLENGEPVAGPSPTLAGGGGVNTMPHVLHDPATGAAVSEGAACAVDPPPDGRRYAACGDGVAAPVAHWIALRLAAVDRGEDPDGP